MATGLSSARCGIAHLSSGEKARLSGRADKLRAAQRPPSPGISGSQSFDGGARRRAARQPLVPDAVHAFEVGVDVLQVDGHREDPGLVGAGLFQQMLDGRQGLAGLLLDARTCPRPPGPPGDGAVGTTIWLIRSLVCWRWMGILGVLRGIAVAGNIQAFGADLRALLRHQVGQVATRRPWSNRGAVAGIEEQVAVAGGADDRGAIRGRRAQAGQKVAWLMSPPSG